MKVDKVVIGDDGVEIVAGQTTLRYVGVVEHSLLIDRDGKMDLSLTVRPPRMSERGLRPATPPRNTR